MFTRRVAPLLVTVLASVSLVAGCQTDTSTNPSSFTVTATRAAVAARTRGTHLADNFGPMGYSVMTGEVFGNRKTASGAYNTVAIEVGDPSAVRSVTQGNARFGDEDTHRSVSDVSPDGRYLLLEVERPSHFPCFTPACAHADEAGPGRGAYNQVWLATVDGEHAWQLSDIDADGGLGSFWARFDTTGTRVVFSEIMQPAGWPEYFGGEQLVVSTISWTNGVPHLTNRIDLGNGIQFFEPFGFDPTGTAVIASSDVLTPGDPAKARILRFPIDGSAPTPLTSALGDGWQEFAFLRPDKTGYVVSSGYNGWIGGVDRWLVRAAAPHIEPARVTHFADYKTGNPQAGISGGMAFIDNDRAVVGFTQHGVENAYLVAVPAS